jgi:hypothetical protein
VTEHACWNKSTNLDIVMNYRPTMGGIVKLNKTHCRRKHFGRFLRYSECCRLFSVQLKHTDSIVIAIRHIPTMQGTILRPVMVHILECPYKRGKGVPVNMQSP